MVILSKLIFSREHYHGNLSITKKYNSITLASFFNPHPFIAAPAQHSAYFLRCLRTELLFISATNYPSRINRLRAIGHSTKHLQFISCFWALVIFHLYRLYYFVSIRQHLLKKFLPTPIVFRSSKLSVLLLGLD